MAISAKHFAAILVLRNKLDAFITNEAKKVALNGDSEITIDLANFGNAEYVKHYLVDVLKFEFIHGNEKYITVSLNEEYRQMRDFRFKLEAEVTNLAADAIDNGKNHCEFDVESDEAAKIAYQLLIKWEFNVSYHETHMRVEW